MVPLTRRFFRGFVYWREGVFAERHIKRLKEFERQSPEEKRRQSFAYLRHLTFRAYHSVPYYKRRFDEIGFNPRDLRSPQDLLSIPILEKRDIIEHRHELIGTGRDVAGASWDATGGSTGEPVQFLRSRLALALTLANEHRTWRWYGVPHHARHALIWGSDRDVPPERSARDWRSRLLGVCRLNAFYLDDERCDKFTDILSEFRPQIIYGYATALAQYSRFLREAGRRLPVEPRAIRSTAEVLLPEHRRLIEDQLGGPVLDYYGSREAGPIAGESPGCDGLHVFSDITYVEIVRPDGAACEPGEVGDVVVSKLHEHAMPFLRYRIGDRAAFLPDDDAGHGLPRISPVQGRVGDFIRTPNGRTVHGEFFTHLFYGVEGVTRFQIQQPEPDRLLILVQGNVERGALERIREASAEHFGAPEPDAVSVESVDEILPGPSGKHRFVLPYEKPMRAR